MIMAWSLTKDNGNCFIINKKNDLFIPKKLLPKTYDPSLLKIK